MSFGDRCQNILERSIDKIPSGMFLFGALIPAVALVGLIVSITGLGADDSYSTGSRSGTVVKLSRRGLIWKTWEGEIAVGAVGIRSGKDGTKAVPVVFDFSVTDQTVIDALTEAMDSGSAVTVSYAQPYVMSWSVGSSGTLVTNVRRHEEASK